jgi:hypothetical protein
MNADAVVKALEHGNAMSRYQYLAVLSELSIEVARNSDLTPDEVFRRLASLPRETVMDEASRLVEDKPSLKEVILGLPTKSFLRQAQEGHFSRLKVVEGLLKK